MKTVPDDADDRHTDEDDRREGEGDDGLAGDRITVRDHPKETGKQKEHEECKDKREEFAPAMPDIRLDHIGDELVAHLGERLPSAGNESTLAGTEDDERGDQH